jgi:hypothetical protein
MLNAYIVVVNRSGPDVGALARTLALQGARIDHARTQSAPQAVLTQDLYIVANDAVAARIRRVPGVLKVQPERWGFRVA